MVIDWDHSLQRFGDQIGSLQRLVDYFVVLLRFGDYMGPLLVFGDWLRSLQRFGDRDHCGGLVTGIAAKVWLWPRIGLGIDCDCFGGLVAGTLTPGPELLLVFCSPVTGSPYVYGLPSRIPAHLTGKCGMRLGCVRP